MRLSILYRGPLSSCNYGCDYCPFAKHRETYEEHEHDRYALERFLDWMASRSQDRIAVFFTPWGEALVRRRYQEAFVRLSALPQATKVAIQTNDANANANITRDQLLTLCREALTRRLTGMVGRPERDFGLVAALRPIETAERSCSCS